MANPDYGKRATLAEDREFHQRVRIALLRSASNVIGEAQTVDPAHPQSYWDKRTKLGQDIVVDSAGTANAGYSALVVRYATVVAATFQSGTNPQNNDVDLQTAIDSVWDDIASTYPVATP